MNNLNRCDLALATFSFGNSNGMLDAALLGIPTVALLCPDPHAQTDWRLLSRLGLADELVATSPDQYLAIARRLVEDRAAREALQARLGPDQVAATIHQDLAPRFRHGLRRIALVAVSPSHRHPRRRMSPRQRRGGLGLK